MGKIIITGDGNVVGNYNTVTVHKGLQSDDLRQLGEAFALLRGEIEQLSVPEKVRNQTIRAVEDAEEEASDKSADVDTIKNSLNRAKEILEDAGEVYDKTKSWGKRLSDLAQTMIKYYPTVAGWASSLF